MVQPRLVISTCGTSPLTANADQALRKLLVEFANAKAAQVPPHVRQSLISAVERCRQFLEKADADGLAQCSAELNSLVKFYNGRLQGTDHHILIASDTWLGDETSHLVRGVLERYGHVVEEKTFTGLRTDDLQKFRFAMAELVRWAYTILPEYRKRGYRIVFNLTGGFKAVQGFLQTLGILLADECIYVFERSNDLLRLPRLPVVMSEEPYLRKHMTLFRRMQNDLAVTPKEAQGIPELLWENRGGRAALSEWGWMVWMAHREKLYGECLWDPPSDLIKYGPELSRSIRPLTNERLFRINEKIDDLAVFLEEKKRLSSLDVKKIQGGPLYGATHEIDAWHDGAAPRLYAHYEGYVLVIDRLDKALH